DRVRSHAAAGLAPPPGPRPDPVDRILLTADLGASRVGDLVDLLAVALLRAHQVLVLELLQHRVDGARARLVETTGAVLQPLHQVVAVPGRLLEQREQREPHLTRPEEPPSRPAPAPLPHTPEKVVQIESPPPSRVHRHPPDISDIGL